MFGLYVSLVVPAAVFWCGWLVYDCVQECREIDRSTEARR
jgi:hypothetical protein